MQTLVLTGLLWAVIGEATNHYKIIGRGGWPLLPRGGGQTLVLTGLLGGGASLGRPQDIFKIIWGGGWPLLPPPPPAPTHILATGNMQLNFCKFTDSLA